MTSPLENGAALPRLYEMDRLWPREILGLHAYVTAYSHWFQLSKKAETLSELRPHVDEAHAYLKQLARSFDFFLNNSSRMNLEQPLPLQTRHKKTKTKALRG